MSVFRKYSQAGGAIHDLEYIAGLSTERTIPLLLSERVAYVLTNLANQDVGFECRWAVERQQAGYLRLTTDDAEYSLFVDVVSEIGYQLRERQAGVGTLLNFKELLNVTVNNENASVGYNTLEITDIPENEVWVVEYVAAVDINSNPAMIILNAGLNMALVPVGKQAAPGVSTWVVAQGPVTLSYPQSLLAEFVGCVAGDDIYLRAIGYKMDKVV